VTPFQRHRELDGAWLEAVELDDLRDERQDDHAVLPFPLLRWLFSHLRRPWEAFDELPAELRQRSWAALQAEAERERAR
jgi:hypothetical protein